MSELPGASPAIPVGKSACACGWELPTAFAFLEGEPDPSAIEVTCPRCGAKLHTPLVDAEAEPMN